MVTSSKDNNINIFDPLCARSIVQFTHGHESTRKSEVVLLRNENILSSGADLGVSLGLDLPFSQLRKRQSRPNENVLKVQKKSFVCRICNRHLATQSSLKRHNLKIHSEILNLTINQYACPSCERIFTHNDNYRQHIKTHGTAKRRPKKSKNKIIICYYCSQKYTRKIDTFTWKQVSKYVRL